MATERDTRAETWYGTDQQVSQLRGRLFRYTTLLASIFGIAMVTVLLTRVFLDATRPTTADAGWLATMLATVVLPTLALLAYYARTDRRAAWIGAMLAVIPVFGLIFGTGVVVLFIQVLSPLEWFGLFIGLLATAGAITVHRRIRVRNSGERTILTAILLLLTVVGIPDLGTGFRVLSLSEIVQRSTPVLPSDLVIVLATLALPVAIAIGLDTSRRREATRAGAVAGGFVFAGSALGILLGPIAGVAPEHAVILLLAVFTPLGRYTEGILRTGQHRSALALPVTLFGGALVGYAVVSALGVAGPETWLDWQFLTDLPSRTPAEAGFYPAIIGSIMIMIVIIVGIFPVGVAAAIYLEEYAANDGMFGRLVDLIEINIANLAGVPSVVYGLLALGIFINTAGMGTGTVIVGGLAVGLLILPIIIISAQEAIRAVPDSLRQASYGMGATKWQTVRTVVLPEALPGILTGSILAFGRAIGETAPLLMIGVAGVVFKAPNGFFEKTSAMPRQIFSWASQPSADFRYGVLAAGVVTLLVVLLAMNATAIIIRNKYQRSQ
jgi:phosphate transport system permease protein